MNTSTLAHDPASPANRVDALSPFLQQLSINATSCSHQIMQNQPTDLHLTPIHLRLGLDHWGTQTQSITGHSESQKSPAHASLRRRKKTATSREQKQIALLQHEKQVILNAWESTVRSATFGMTLMYNDGLNYRQYTSIRNQLGHAFVTSKKSGTRRYVRKRLPIRGTLFPTARFSWF